jgi:hypothetical protein
MLEKRIKHQRVIIKQKALDVTQEKKTASDAASAEAESKVPQEEADEETVQETFSTVIAQKKRSSRKPFVPSQPKKKQRLQPTKDEENYINYTAKDYQTESG